MKIVRVRLAPVELPLAQPLATAEGTFTVRPVIVLALWDDAGRVAVSEAAPLVEHRTESYDLAHELLGRLAGRAEYPACGDGFEAIDAWLEALGLARDFAPATCWALCCTLASLAAQAAGRSLAEQLGAHAHSVAANALIGGGTTDEVLAAAERAVAAGYRTIKLKVGTRPVREDVELVRQLRAAQPEVVLRVDANGAWTLDEARQFGHAVTSSAVEYLEDPLGDCTVETLRTLRGAMHVPVALDEPLHDEEFCDAVLSENLCDVLALKPAAVGSLTRLHKLAQAAHARRMGIVISNLLESSLGLSYATICAAALGSAGLAHGLGTAGLLAGDTFATPLMPAAGLLPVPDSRPLTFRLRPDITKELGLS